MTSSRLRATVTVALAAATLVALTACAPAAGKHTGGGSGSHSSASPTPSPTPTVSSLDLTAPTPLIGVNCGSLLTQVQLTNAFGTKPVVQIATNAIATGDLEAQDTVIPSMDYVREAGGVACLFSDQPSNWYASDGSGFPKEHAEQITFLPNAQAAWVNETKLGGETGDMNDGSCDVGGCELDRLINNTWVNTTELNQLGTLKDPFADIVNETKADVVNAGTLGALPTPDAGTLALGGTCTSIVDDASASTALGTTVASAQLGVVADDFDYYGIWSGAQDELKDHPCVWKHGSTVVGHLSWLPGGAWAWNEAKALPLKDGPAAPLTVPGIASGDTAFIRCSAGDASCVADLVIGGNWISAQVSQPGSTNRAAVTALAAAIVIKLG